MENGMRTFPYWITCFPILPKEHELASVESSGRSWCSSSNTSTTASCTGRAQIHPTVYSFRVKRFGGISRWMKDYRIRSFWPRINRKTSRQLSRDEFFKENNLIYRSCFLDVACRQLFKVCQFVVYSSGWCISQTATAHISTIIAWTTRNIFRGRGDLPKLVLKHYMWLNYKIHSVVRVHR